MNKETQNRILETVRRNYIDIADLYNETRRKKMGQTWAELIEFSQQVKDGDDVLDVGCGNGRLIEIFTDKKINYVGIDANEFLLGHARKNFPGYNFITGNVLNLDILGDEKFDYIFSVAVHHHLPGKNLQVKALSEMKKHLKPGGKLILTTWYWRQKKLFKQLAKNTLNKLIGKSDLDYGDVLFDWKNSQGEVVSQRYYHLFTKKGLRKIAEGSGLRIEKIFNDKYNYYIIAKSDESNS